MTQPVRNPSQETIFVITPEGGTGSAQDYVQDRVQSISVDSKYPSETVKELGNRDIVGEVVDIAEHNLTMDAYDVSADVISFLQNKNTHAATPDTQFDVTYEDFVETTIDIITRNIGLDTVLQRDRFTNCVTTGFNYKYTVTGIATEQYTFVTDTKTITNTGIVDTFAEASIHEPTTTHPAGIKGKNIDIYVAGSATALTRVQDFNVNVSFPNRGIFEMGNLNRVATVVDTADVSGDFSVLSTDLDSLYGTAATPLLATGGAPFTETDWTASTTLSLEAVILDPADNTTVLKTVYIPGIVIVGDSTNDRVGEDLVRRFNWKLAANETMVVYKGARP